MSHFLLYVISPPGADAEKHIEKVLAPYSERREVPEHDTRCWCVGRKAKEEAQATADAKHGDWNDRRATFAEKHGTGPKYPFKGTDAEREAYEEAEEAHTLKWQEHIAPALAAEAAALEAHPLKDAADPSCDECAGKGTVKSTSNPRGYWDWYTIGGRWESMFREEYDPEKDPRNLETCFLCVGTGKRNDELGRREREQDPTYTCNGCQGTGQKVKWPSKWVDGGGNALPAGELLARVKANTRKYVPFALVDVSGEWHQKGEMGWFGFSRNEMKREEWHEQVARLLAATPPDATVTVVDCHT